MMFINDLYIDKRLVIQEQLCLQNDKNYFNKSNDEIDMNILIKSTIKQV